MDLSFPDAPLRDQRERVAWIVERDGEYQTVLVPTRSDACGVLGRELYNEPVPEGAVGLIHTHPSPTGTITGEGDCERVGANVVLGSGPSSGDVENVEYFEEITGSDLVGIILEPDQVYEFTASNPSGTSYPGCRYR